MTQKTTTLADKIESIKAALEFYTKLDPAHPDSADVIFDDGNKATEALATLQELETEMGKEAPKKKKYKGYGE